MRRISNVLTMLMMPIALGISSLASPVLNRAILTTVHGVQDMSRRSADTCADPSLARTVIQGHSGTNTAHVVHFHYVFVDVDSKQGTGPPLWSFQGAVFKAWPTQQPFTVPLFRLATSTSSDFIFLTGADAQTPPVVGGFTVSGIVGWVYDTAVCDSVPLMSAVLASATDHYYTTDPDEHAGLLARGGWTDGGVVAFVLPLPTY